MTDDCSNKGGFIREGIFFGPVLSENVRNHYPQKVEVSDFAHCFEDGTEGKYLLRFNPLLILVYFTKATIIFYVNGIRFGNSRASVLWGSVLS